MSPAYAGIIVNKTAALYTARNKPQLGYRAPVSGDPICCVQWQRTRARNSWLMQVTSR